MSALRRPEPGTPLVFRWRKWDASPHWEHDCVYLGSDDWGDWVGQRTGWRSHRPGREIVTEAPNVTLIPPSGDYALTVNTITAPYRIYIDIAWDVHWEDGTPVGIDMDLDVIRTNDQRGVFIDDQDEWDEHRVAYGYPKDIVTRLEALAIDLRARVAEAAPPFDDTTGGRWLDALAAFEETR